MTTEDSLLVSCPQCFHLNDVYPSTPVILPCEMCDFPIFVASIFQIPFRLRFDEWPSLDLINIIEELFDENKVDAKTLLEASELVVLQHVSECSVCLEPLTGGRKISCGHVFHVDCIEPWFRIHTTCPLCRKELK